MSLYHFHVGSVGRSTGSSSLATLSYIAGMRTVDERTGRRYYGFADRHRLERVQPLDPSGTRCRVLLPEGAPREYADPQRLFNGIEAVETNGRAVVAKKFEIALDRSWSIAESVRAIDEFLTRHVTSRGYAAAYSIHHDEANNNPHVHVLVANRRIDPKTGQWARTKTRKTYALDADGQRIPVIDPETGRQKLGKRNERMWKRVTVAENTLGTKETLLELREGWAETYNRHLPDGADKVSHLTLAAQGRTGAEAIPTVHEGSQREIEKRGGKDANGNPLDPQPRCSHNRLVRIRRAIQRATGVILGARMRAGQLKRRIEDAARRLVNHPARPTPAAEAPERTPENITESIASKWEALIGRINTGTDARPAPTGGRDERADHEGTQRQPPEDHGDGDGEFEALISESVSLRESAKRERGAAKREGRLAEASEAAARAERIEREAREREEARRAGREPDSGGRTTPEPVRRSHRGR